MLLLAITPLLTALLLRRLSDRECSAQASFWFPLLDVVEYEEYDFADAFDSQSIYRGPPVPERENAWIQLTHKHAVEIPEDKLPYLNRSHDPSDLRHVPENVGTGYIAIIEVSHQLHCLNLLRQYTWLQAGKHTEIPGSHAVGSRQPHAR